MTSWMSVRAAFCSHDAEYVMSSITNMCHWLITYWLLNHIVLAEISVNKLT